MGLFRAKVCAHCCIVSFQNFIPVTPHDIDIPLEMESSLLSFQSHARVGKGISKKCRLHRLVCVVTGKPLLPMMYPDILQREAGPLKRGTAYVKSERLQSVKIFGFTIVD